MNYLFSTLTRTSTEVIFLPGREVFILTFSTCSSLISVNSLVSLSSKMMMDFGISVKITLITINGYLFQISFFMKGMNSIVDGR